MISEVFRLFKVNVVSKDNENYKAEIFLDGEYIGLVENKLDYIDAPMFGYITYEQKLMLMTAIVDSHKSITAFKVEKVKR